MQRLSATARVILPIAALLLAATLVIACGSGSESSSGDSPPTAPAPEPTPEPTPPAPEPEPTPEPEPEPEPEPSEPLAGGGAFSCIAGDVAAGATKYAQLCASCHGAGGAGDGPAAAALNPQPASHADGAYMNALSNEHVYTVIKDGGIAVGKSASMAPWGSSLSEQELWDVVAFVRSLAVPAYACP